MLSWYTYTYNPNAKRIESYDIFSHGGFLKDCRAAAKKFRKDKGSFAEEVKTSLMYYFWSKCEWETILSAWPPTKDRSEEIKIDVFGQVNLNWPVFIEWLWDHKLELNRED